MYMYEKKSDIHFVGRMNEMNIQQGVNAYWLMDFSKVKSLNARVKHRRHFVQNRKAYSLCYRQTSAQLFPKI